MLYTRLAGCEHAGDMPLPPGQSEPFDAEALLQALPTPRAYADDKVLYLTQRKLKPRSLISGELPTAGFALQNGPRALVSSAGVKVPEAGLKIIARHAMQVSFRTWEIALPRARRGIRPDAQLDAGDTFFETFCRDKSEQKIRLAKS